MIVYLNGILIFSNSKEEYIKHVETVLQQLRHNKLYAKPEKYCIGAKTVKFCGHEVGVGEIRPAPMKLDII